MVLDLICVALLLFQFVFLLRIVTSFFPIQYGSTLAAVRGLTITVTEPVLMPLRRRLPPLPGMMAAFGIAELVLLILLVVLLAIVC